MDQLVQEEPNWRAVHGAILGMEQAYRTDQSISAPVPIDKEGHAGHEEFIKVLFKAVYVMTGDQKMQINCEDLCDDRKRFKTDPGYRRKVLFTAADAFGFLESGEFLKDATYTELDFAEGKLLGFIISS